MPDISQIIIMVLISAVGGLIGVVFYFLKGKIKGFNTTLETIKHNVRAIANCLFKAKDIDFDPSLLRDYSPLNITEQGKQYLTNTGFVKVFKENKKDFFKLIDLEKPKMKYDVEFNAVKTIFSLIEKDYFKPVKIFFYNNPRKDFRAFAKMAGVYVRDDYLEEHPEITQ